MVIRERVCGSVQRRGRKCRGNSTSIRNFAIQMLAFTVICIYGILYMMGQYVRVTSEKSSPVTGGGEEPHLPLLALVPPLEHYLALP